MKAKAKAKELVDRFELLENNQQIMYETGLGELEDVEVSFECAKQCALICVDEILQVIERLSTGADHTWFGDDIDWEEVKAEIEKL